MGQFLTSKAIFIKSLTIQFKSMVSEKYKWDNLTSIFNTHTKKIDKSAADNIDIAWPAIVRIIDENIVKKPNLRVLDYGCGAGAFCDYLNKKEFIVTGIDFSSSMIDIAKNNTSSQIDYLVGDKNILKKVDKKFDIITSIMVFQFIEDFKSYLNLFHKILEKEGIVVFAVHNPDFIEACVKNNVKFKYLDKSTAQIEFNSETKIKIYIRSEKDYKQLFQDKGFNFTQSNYPKFTNEFIEKYNWTLPTVPEFLVMGFRK